LAASNELLEWEIGADYLTAVSGPGFSSKHDPHVIKDFLRHQRLVNVLCPTDRRI